jgi:hypothetical protein
MPKPASAPDCCKKVRRFIAESLVHVYPTAKTVTVVRRQRRAFRLGDRMSMRAMRT